MATVRTRRLPGSARVRGAVADARGTRLRGCGGHGAGFISAAEFKERFALHGHDLTDEQIEDIKVQSVRARRPAAIRARPDARLTARCSSLGADCA